METFKKILTISVITIIVTIILGNNLHMVKCITNDYSVTLPVRVALFTKDLNDDYIESLSKNFEDIQKNNNGKVIFNFYDAKFNKSTQISDINNKLNQGVDLILLDIVDINDLAEVIKKIAQYNVPVLVFNREPYSIDVIKSYKKALLVGTDSKQAGILQGKMIAHAWNSNKQAIDKNNDDILQYIMLAGERFNQTSIDRSTYSILTIQQAGIKTQELASPILNWNTESAKSTVEALFLRYGNQIEAIISNDDSMAIGAAHALQKYGYNNGNESKVIPVVGVDGMIEAKELISKGFMLGTALQDPDLANTIYTIGMNLVYDRNPVEGTPYKLDETGVSVLVPFQEYTGPMFK
ncbi:galactose ABC transporter substrate-binding protein [Clostridium saccharobutylicum]|uniref:D-galactose/methyl-galactoside binding periplasmic protein MglB n=1 Tax=Clostridium saccharobutylicum TaxID=169679 RepID=A0A1S8NHQ5_CLOSA|nr:galactose ABC transporter substrate-binding protein [Clostridium saccharobutylicum]OOM16026.1 D-galactose-binding periplasmic protein precursor [Clostridium saccharobutylicum]